ncbi:MAG: ribosome biogenesis GTPase Der [Coxiellaceae bacterium]|nr:ribosome biogenesis GTPase Der [Coxiellaceae bacterium]
MLPVIAIVGRPNVGKSTLFNVLTKTRDALVADMPGVTRDRQYGKGEFDERAFVVIDTGGIGEHHDREMDDLTDQQVELALQEADHILFMVDAKAGLMPADEEIAKRLRPLTDKVTLVVNKSDRVEAEIAGSEFYRLGIGEPEIIASAHRRGIGDMMEAVMAQLPEEEAESDDDKNRIHVAVIGRPNVGKSTLINRILGEERVVVCDRPGTTRDSVSIPFDRQDQRYMLIDTAGVRRRTKVTEKVEKFSVIKTIQAIERAHVVVVMVDAREGIGEQDMRLMGWVLEAGKGIILTLNKWDGMDEYDKGRIKEAIDRKLPFLDFARRYFISALHGSGVGKLFHAIDEAYESGSKEITTAQLTKVLEDATKNHQPPMINGRRIKMRYAHIGSHHPLVIVIHGKQLTDLPGSYERYLSTYFRKTFDLVGVPVRIRLRSDKNPYAK